MKYEPSTNFYQHKRTFQARILKGLFYFMGKHFVKDIFKPLIFCQGKYHVSRFGKVKSIYTMSKTGHIKLTGTILKTTINHKGYEKVRLQWTENGQLMKKTMAVHRLVAIAFIPNPENKPHINHKDCNPLNNYVTNLEWCTPKENVNHAQMMGRMPTAKPYIKKGRPEGIKKIINTETGEIFNTAKELSKRLQISRHNIHRQLNGERYCNIPYRYVGEEDRVRIKPLILPKQDLVGKFISGVFVEMIDRLKQDEKTNGRIGKLLAGLCGVKDGIKYKKPDGIGGFIEPPIFISQKKIIIRGPATPKKPLIQLTEDGKTVKMYPSISDAAKAFGTNRRNFSKAIVKSPRNYYKGFIFKYA